MPDAETQSGDATKTLSRRDRRRPGRRETVSPEILALLRSPAGPGPLPQDDIAHAPADNGKVATPENQIIDFLVAHKGKPFCDDCLMQQVRYADSPAITIAMKAIGAAFGFRRATVLCASCSDVRVGIRAR